MARIIRKEEKAILSFTEIKILEKALDILNDIAEDCEHNDDLYEYSDDARDNLEQFLNNKDIYEVDENTEPKADYITIQITL